MTHTGSADAILALSNAGASVMAADKDGLTGKFYLFLSILWGRKQTHQRVTQIKGYNPVTFNHIDLGGLFLYVRGRKMTTTQEQQLLEKNKADNNNTPVAFHWLSYSCLLLSNGSDPADWDVTKYAAGIAFGELVGYDGMLLAPLHFFAK